MGEERPSVDWLPAGWKVEARVRRNGKKDKYYIDPVTGHLFRSMKEVFRYLSTGKIARHSSKPKDQEPIKVEWRHRSISSPSETGKDRSANNKALKVDIENSSHKAAEEAPATGHVNQPKFDNLEKRENKEKSSESISPVVEDLQEKPQRGHGTECKKKKKLNKKRGAELPRRISERLAGIAVELPLEQKMSNQVHEAAKCADNYQDSKNSDEHVKRVRTGNGADKKQEELDALSPGDTALLEQHAKLGVVERKGDEKQEMPLASSLKNLWKDPCIEFAVKTLTGAIPIVDEDKVAEDPVFSVDLPVAVPENQDLPHGDIWADPCFEFAVKTLTGDVPMENDRNVQSVFLQPHYSSNFGGEKGSLLPNFWSNENPDVAKKPFHKQL